MKKAITPNYTNVCNFLRKCFFNPQKVGPLKIISEIGNSHYYEMRAIEFIKESQNLSTRLFGDFGTYDDYIIKAIQLLVLARETRVLDLQKAGKEFHSINLDPLSNKDES
jgi:hypothetical protein